MDSSFRSLVKRGVERALVGIGGPRIARAIQSGRAVILAYHNVVPEGGASGGDRSLHLPVETFARQLDYLARTHRVVPLEQLLEEVTTDRGPPVAAITFDDGYRGALTAGLSELSKRGLAATFFVCPGLLGADGVWWDELATMAGDGVSGDFRHEAVVTCRGEADRVYRLAERWGLRGREQPRHAGLATEEELRSAVSVPGITLGSHTWSHPNLDRLDPAELQSELDRSLRWLGERFEGVTVPWLSLPYGRGAPEVFRVAREIGYVRGLRISGGLARPDEGEWALDRVNVPSGASIERFALSTAGV